MNEYRCNGCPRDEGCGALERCLIAQGESALRLWKKRYEAERHAHEETRTLYARSIEKRVQLEEELKAIRGALTKSNEECEKLAQGELELVTQVSTKRKLLLECVRCGGLIGHIRDIDIGGSSFTLDHYCPPRSKRFTRPPINEDEKKYLEYARLLPI